MARESDAEVIKIAPVEVDEIHNIIVPIGNERVCVALKAQYTEPLSYCVSHGGLINQDQSLDLLTAPTASKIILSTEPPRK